MRAVRASAPPAHAAFAPRLASTQLQAGRSQLYRRRFLQPNIHFSVFFRDLQYFHTCAPLETRNVSKIPSNVAEVLTEVYTIRLKIQQSLQELRKNQLNFEKCKTENLQILIF